MRKNHLSQMTSRNFTSTLLIISILLISIISVSLQAQTAALGEQHRATTVRFYPQPSPQAEITSNGQTFTVACVVEDVTDLGGLDVQMQWNTTYLSYVSHTQTMTVEDYPAVQPPSPYAGIIHNPPLALKDIVNTTEGTYWAAFATLGGPGFDGNGTVFVMTFVAINLPFGDPAQFFYTYLNLTVDLADSLGSSIPAIIEDGEIKHWKVEVSYPPWPLLKIDPISYEASAINETFTYDVWLAGDNNTDLDPFWDVAGIDVYMNFNSTLMEALNVTIDPDGTFESFWSDGIFELADEINNTAGTIHVSVMGYGESHNATSGQIRMFNVTFLSIFASDTSPPPSAAIYLESPVEYTGAYKFDSISGVINIANPVGTTYYELVQDYLDGPFELTSWEDNGDGILSPSDQFILNHTTTGFYFDYHLDEISGTLNLTQQPYQAVEDYVWAASFGPDNLAYNGLPGRYVGTDDPYNGFGVPYWTGNFSMPLLDSVNSITVHALPFTPDNYTYTLTAGVDYKVYPDDDLIELLTPLDVQIINETWTDGVDNVLGGWPWINYVASGIESVYVDMHNGTARFGVNLGYAEAPPSEWWYDPDWAWELEGWWALGYYPGSWNWLAGSTWWINYTAASYMSIDYNSEPDPDLRYIDFDGSYTDFLALGDPVDSNWTEVYPRAWRTYTVVGWTDSDSSSNITSGDYIDVIETAGNRTYLVNDVSTDISVQRKRWISEVSPNPMDDPFFGVAPIVQVPGFPHPDIPYSPWFNKEYSLPLPHKVENATYTAPLAQQPPDANFTYEPTDIFVFDTVTFNASDSSDLDGYIVSYFWEFGDGTNATGITTTHAYDTNGTFTATLTVTDNSSLTDTYSQQIRVRPLLVLTLTPNTGFASTTITGENFDPNSTITIIWDGTPIPTVPQPLISNEHGSFTAIISVLTQNDPGVHNITATDENGHSIQETFTVIDMTGPQGPQGEQGPSGVNGTDGVDGIDGVNGTDGAAGIDGVDGTDGVDGETGAQGPQGSQGEQGPSGAPELSYASIILAIVAMCVAIYIMLKKR